MKSDDFCLFETYSLLLLILDLTVATVFMVVTTSSLGMAAAPKTNKRSTNLNQEPMPIPNKEIALFKIMKKLKILTQNNVFQVKSLQLQLQLEETAMPILNQSAFLWRV